MDSPRKISLKNFLLLCLLISFMGLYMYERTRSSRLEQQISAMTRPLDRQIAAARLNINNQRTQLEFAIARLGPETDLQSLYREVSKTDSSTGSPVISSGMRRQLANVRNLELKIEREEQQLIELEHQLRILLDPTSGNE